MRSQLVSVICADGECRKRFTYHKRSNVTRKFCTKCAVARVKASKERSLRNQREERRWERVAQEKLKKIPDVVINPNKLLDHVARDLT